MRDDRAQSKIHPIIVVHAITAAGLRDEYRLDHQRVWSPFEMATTQFGRIELFPSLNVERGKPRYDADEPALVRPSEMFGVIYKELFAELRHNLSHDDIPEQPVYPFVYDWRQSNFVTIQHLAAFVEEVINRTSLMPHKADLAPVCERVDLIGHSMGGLVIAGTLASGLLGKNATCKVRRVVTLGTPFRGASASITKLSTGSGPLWGRNSRERERTTARVTPSVYQLLPSFPAALVKSRTNAKVDVDMEPKDFDPGDVLDIWDTESYQPSIAETLAEHILEVEPTRAMTKTAAKQGAADLFKQLLDEARAYRELTDSVDPKQLGPNGGWLAIVGAGEETHTRTGLTNAASPNKRRFDVATGRTSSGWDGKTHATGDQTVPLQGARPPWKLPHKNTVVVTSRDWRFEIGDEFLQRAMGFHGALPLLNLAQRWIINFLRPEWAKGRVGQHGRLWGRPLPEVSLPDKKKDATTMLEELWDPMIPGIELRNAPGGYAKDDGSDED